MTFNNRSQMQVSFFVWLKSMGHVNQGQVYHIIKECSILFLYSAASNFSIEQNNLHSKSEKKGQKLVKTLIMKLMNNFPLSEKIKL